VPRILNPVVLVLDELPQLAKDPNIRAYMDAAFGAYWGRAAPCLRCSCACCAALRPGLGWAPCPTKLNFTHHH